MKGLLLALAYIAVLALVSGCSHYQQAIVADSATTLIGLQSADVVELNPLFSNASPEAAALGGAIVSGVVIAVAKRSMPVAECESFLHLFTSIKYGAAANNLAVIAGASGAIPAVIWIGTALAVHRFDLARDRCD